jgi:Spy/CpxP family protein refolding chaperone
MRAQRRVKLQVWLLILAVFALGGVTGASLDRLYLIKQGPDRPGVQGSGQRWRQQLLENMKRDLNLSDDQVTKIRTVFEENRKEFNRRRISECPGFKEMREKSDARIRSVLTPQQQERFDQIKAQREADQNIRK